METGVHEPRATGLRNLRSLAGTRILRGQVASGRLWRSEALHHGAPTALDELIGQGLTDVLDLRSDHETRAAPSPARGRAGIQLHRCPILVEDGVAPPWVTYTRPGVLEDVIADSYLASLVGRPDEVVRGLMALTRSKGACLVHCSAGKDRTAVFIGTALLLAGASLDAVVADYERTPAGLTWALQKESGRTSDEQRGNPAFVLHPDAYRSALTWALDLPGGIAGLFVGAGWTADASRSLRDRLAGFA